MKLACDEVEVGALGQCWPVGEHLFSKLPRKNFNNSSKNHTIHTCAKSRETCALSRIHALCMDTENSKNFGI